MGAVFIVLLLSLALGVLPSAIAERRQKRKGL
jgi:hypothetical protein